MKLIHPVMRSLLPASPVIVELGAHDGSDTREMTMNFPQGRIVAVEPNPYIGDGERFAITNYNGSGTLLISHPTTYSSSLREPTGHLEKYPRIQFKESIRVVCMTLDTFYEHKGITKCDFLWADIQGSEGDMISGGPNALRNTHYLYFEAYDSPMYAGSATQKELIAMLPNFRVIQYFRDTETNVLMENKLW